jgi:hypothetical protein
LTVTNNGTATLNITNTVFAPADYALSSSSCGAPPIAIPASGSCNFLVTFTPAAAGSRPGSFTFTDNAPGSPHAVSLSGTGTVDFTVTPENDTATVSRGSSASYSLSLSSLGGFSGTITFTCSGNPTRSTCNPPASTALAAGETKSVNLSIATQAPSAAPPFYGPFKAPPLGAPQSYMPWLLAWLLLATLTLKLAGRRRRTLALLAATLLMALFWTACGGGGGGGTPPPTGGTPTGNFNITVTAKSGGITKTAALVLTVN